MLQECEVENKTTIVALVRGCDEVCMSFKNGFENPEKEAF